MPIPAQHLLSLGDDLLRFAKKRGASAADALMIEATEMNAGIRHGKPETIERAESAGIGLRVFVGESSATLSTSDLAKKSLEDLAARAVAIAKAAPADPHARLVDKKLLAKRWGDLDLSDTAEPSMATLQETARKTEEAGLAIAGITNSEGADASFSHHLAALVTSHGFAGSYVSSRSAMSVSLIAGLGASMQRDYDYAMATHRRDLPKAADIGRRAGQRTAARINPRKLPSQQAAVFFEPRVGKQLVSAFASAISGTAIARGTSFLKNDLGKQVFSDSITIVDDPLLKRGLGSRPFDAEGVSATRREFVAQGKLTSWLLDNRSANQLGLKTTGHAMRGLSSAPHPSPTNLYLKAGFMTSSELYSSVRNGLMVTETIGHGANLITGDYSVGASGFWIEDGQIAFAVSEITIAANLRDIFRELVAANDLEFHYSINAPTVMVPRMTIAGN